MKACHEILRELREDRDLKQAQIAAVLNITQQQYSKYENNITELPARVLAVLAEYYQVSADYLLGRVPHQEDNWLRADPALLVFLSDFKHLTPEQRACIVKLVHDLGQ